MDELNRDKNNELGSLENSTTVIEPTNPKSGNDKAVHEAGSAPSAPNSPTAASAPPGQQGRVHRLIGQFNIYLLFFALLLILAGVVGVIFYLKAQSENTTNDSL